MNFKNWAMGLLALLVMNVVFPACSDDDDKGPAFNAEGKRLVSKITGGSQIYTDEKDEISFHYNGDGQITAIEWKLAYFSEELNKKCTDSEYATFSVDGRKLRVVRKYEDGEFPEDSGTYTGDFILNEDGYMESGNETDEDDDKFIYKCYYENNHLDKFEYTRNGKTEGRPIDYTWNNGDISKGVYNGTYTYYENVNKANIDFCEATQMEFMLGYDRSYLGLAGFLGKNNKHLLKRGDDSYSYKYDNEGYVVEITIGSDDDGYVYKVSYN